MMAQVPRMTWLPVAVPMGTRTMMCTNSPGFTGSGDSSNEMSMASALAPMAAPTTHDCTPSARRRGALPVALSVVASETAVDPTAMAHWSTVAVVATAAPTFTASMRMRVISSPLLKLPAAAAGTW